MPTAAGSVAALGLDTRGGFFNSSGAGAVGEARRPAPPSSSAPLAAASNAPPASPSSSSLSAPSPLRALLAFATSPPRGLTLRAFPGLASKQQPQPVQQQQPQQQQPQQPPAPAPAPPIAPRRRSLRSAVREVEGRWYREALVEAKSGDAEAMLRVAEMCEVGYGTPVDYDLADDWRELADLAVEKQQRRELEQEQQEQRTASASAACSSERQSSELPTAPHLTMGGGHQEATRSFERMSLADERMAPVAPSAFSSGSMLSSAQISFSGAGGA